MIQSDDARIGALRSRLRGPLFLPDVDPDAFGESCRIWNGMIESRPTLVVRATGTADVVECVRFAREQGLLIAAKAGGHNIAGTCLARDGLTVDLSRMKGVLVDRARKQVRVQGGCVLGDVDRETQLHGLAAVLGFVSETGVAGLTLGGGIGYLSRRFGWTSDNLLEVEIVTADGNVLTASANENADLFWALRGAGHNFGIVTSFTFRLHEVGPTITGGLIAFPAERAPEVLAAVAEVSARKLRELTLATAMRLAPPMPAIPKDWHGKPIVAVIVCHSGTSEQAEKDLAPLRACAQPIVDGVVPKPYCAQQMMLDAGQPKGLHYYWKSEYLPVLTEPMLETYRTHAAGVPTAQSQVVLFQLGGAIADRPADDGAVGNRDAEYTLIVSGAWQPDDPNGAEHIRWVRSTWEAMRPHATGGVYVNFLTEEEGNDRVQAAYRDNFARLATLKAKYDPDNVFRSNKNVLPQG
jgi:FAD/FMN-containing dehydrogenase